MPTSAAVGKNTALLFSGIRADFGLHMFWSWDFARPADLDNFGKDLHAASIMAAFH